jgi:GDPmannose 4,6-dehydratase
MKKVLITGITGQDGSYLAELLLEKNYEVHGIVRQNSLKDVMNLKNIKHIQGKLFLHEGDLTDRSILYEIFSNVIPDEFYHLSAISFVSYSVDDEFLIINNNFNSTHYILSIIREVNKKCKFFFAGSSEMFGEPSVTPQTENTPFNPKSIYGISKVSSYFLVKYYREKESLFACTGIMYNHESPRRGNEFVTKKIISSAVRIKKGLQKELYLGNLDVQRDWGYSPDYVKAIWQILQQKSPDDFIISTGILHSVKEFLEITFSYLDLNYKDYVKVDMEFFRASEENPLSGDCSKIKNRIGWKNKMELKDIIKVMIDDELESNKDGGLYEN